MCLVRHFTATSLSQLYLNCSTKLTSFVKASTREFVIDGVTEGMVYETEEVIVVVLELVSGGGEEAAAIEGPFSFSIFFLIFAIFFSHPCAHFSRSIETVAVSTGLPPPSRLFEDQVTFSILLQPPVAFVNLLRRVAKRIALVDKLRFPLRPFAPISLSAAMSLIFAILTSSTCSCRGSHRTRRGKSVREGVQGALRLSCYPPSRTEGKGGR